MRLLVGQHSPFDLGLAFRHAARNRGFSALVISMLALGLGCVVGVLSIVRATLFAPVPYRDADRVVMLWAQTKDAGPTREPFSPPDMLDIRNQSRTIADIAAVNSFGGSIVGSDGVPEQIQLGVTTGNFFEVLGADAALGTTYQAADDTPMDTRNPNNVSVVVLTHGLWSRRYGADPSVIGTIVRIGGSPMLVRGVLPSDFHLRLPPDAGVSNDLAAYTPLRVDYAASPRQGRYLRLLGRLVPGADVATASAELDVIAQRLREQHPHHAGSELRLRVAVLHETAVQHARPILFALAAAVLVFLVVAWVNLASLVLVRYSTRAQELEVRSALGASRARLVAQLVAENAVLAIAGVAGAIAIAWLLTRAASAIIPATLAHVRVVPLDGTSVFVAIGVAAMSLTVFAVVPALLTLKRDMATSLRERSATGSVGWRTFRGALISGEVALSTALLIAALLLLRGTVAFARQDFGFVAERVLTFNVALPFTSYRGPEAWSRFFERYREQLVALQGVQAVGASTDLPGTAVSTAPFAPDVATAEAQWGNHQAGLSIVTPGFLEANRITLREGRMVNADDVADRPLVAVVDETIAERLGGTVVGRQIAVQSERFERGYTVERRTVTIVGIVASTHLTLAGASAPGMIYLPFAQHPTYALRYALRTTGDPLPAVSAAREALAGLDARLPIYGIQTLDDVVAANVAPTRFALVVLGWFAAVSVLFAGFGLYAVIAFSVRQRRREFGLRMALGATSTGVASNVVLGALRLAIVGLITGGLVAVAVARGLGDLLLGVQPTDAIAFITAIVLVTITSTMAAAIPALRAARVPLRDVLSS